MKGSKRNKINIIFSSFLIIGYIVCTYFFSTLAGQVSGTLGSLIQVLMLVVFGLLLFYATRVGEGRQVKRFSLAVLLLVDIPSLYIILAGLFPGMPLHDAFVPSAVVISGMSTPSIILMLTCVALGYGIPYTFLSGYEIREEGGEEIAEEIAEVEDTLLEGGLAEELAELETEAAEEPAEAIAEAEAIEEAAEEAEEAGTAAVTEE